MQNREVSVIAQGACLDTDPGFGDKMYMIRTWTVRLGPMLLDDWMWSYPMNDRACYETQAEYDAYVAEKAEQHKAVEREIFTALGIEDNEHHTITQILSEIFTVVSIEAIQTGKGGNNHAAGAS